MGKKVVAKQNFHANGVEAKPGQVLTDDEVKKIQPVYDEMKKNELIAEQDAAPAAPHTDAKAPETPAGQTPVATPSADEAKKPAKK